MIKRKAKHSQTQNQNIMPNISPIKGFHSVKTSGAVCKSALPEKQDCDFIKQYMLEKERTRLRNEQSRILMRAEIIQSRLKDIQEFFEETTKQVINLKQKRFIKINEEKTEFKTMLMDY